MMNRRSTGIAFAVVLLMVITAAAAAQQAGDGLEPLLGTWFCQEYDGLYYETFRVTWKADGTLTCISPGEGTSKTIGPFRVVREWSGADGSLVIRLAGDLGGTPCYPLFKVHANGKCCEGFPDSSLAAISGESVPVLTGYRVLVR
jgi:hypothetical protein